MNKMNVWGILLAIFTLLTFIACLAGVVYAFFLPKLEYTLAMGLTCSMLAVFFGLMVRNDYYKFFQQK